MKSGLKFAAVSAVMTGVVVAGLAGAAAAEPPVMPEQGAVDHEGGWPVLPSRPGTPSSPGTPSDSGSPSDSGTPLTEPDGDDDGSQVGLVGVAALGAGLIPLGAWMWRRQRNRRED
ncbi:hypothetical protein AB0I28_25105 [Phytomonospora sp. NPDC050363]|uniref:hypothetical protein n=1 Tax=Phytomonospora sp. NPDC050363 TaxID=3155642 RepID=UPI0033DC9B92